VMQPRAQVRPMSEKSDWWWCEGVRPRDWEDEWKINWCWVGRGDKAIWNWDKEGCMDGFLVVWWVNEIKFECESKSIRH